MNGHTTAPAGSYQDRLEAFRRSDQERDALVTELINKYQELHTKYEEKCDDYDNEVESRRTWQNAAKTSEREMVALRQASGSSPFVVCILDGDGAIFQDYLFAQGKDGGADAASQLQQEIKKQLKDLYPDASVSDWHIVVNIVLNMQGLGSKLQACGIIDSASGLQEFARAFGLAQPLFNFIDVGSGKERADHKIRETLRLYLPIPQCKHIFFGPCHDNGYLPVLEPYKREISVSPRLSLVETRPAERGFHELGFRMISFPRIFRDSDLPAGRRMQSMSTPAMAQSPVTVRAPSNHTMVTAAPFVPQTATTPHQASKSASPAPSSDSTTSGSWATVGKTVGPGNKTINITPTKAAPKRFVVTNVDDERLDQPLPRCDQAAQTRFTARLKDHGKCCNDYHLLGRCEAGEYCDYNHGERLSPGETLVLKHKARSRCCPLKYTCRNPDCTFGHHCKFGKGCTFDECWFADTHYMNFEPAKRIFEDGSEEWVQSYLDKMKK